MRWIFVVPCAVAAYFAARYFSDGHLGMPLAALSGGIGGGIGNAIYIYGFER